MINFDPKALSRSSFFVSVLDTNVCWCCKYQSDVRKKNASDRQTFVSQLYDFDKQKLFFKFYSVGIINLLCMYVSMHFLMCKRSNK